MSPGYAGYDIHGKLGYYFVEIKPKSQENYFQMKNIMKNRYLKIVLLCFVFVVFFCPKIFAADGLTETQALDILVSQVKKDQLYDRWTAGPSCLLFFIEGNTKSYFDFAIREKHGNGCPGDPTTAPIVDRFRINRSTKKIQWYDSEGELLPYNAVLGFREKQ